MAQWPISDCFLRSLGTRVRSTGRSGEAEEELTAPHIILNTQEPAKKCKKKKKAVSLKNPNGRIWHIYISRGRLSTNVQKKTQKSHTLLNTQWWEARHILLKMCCSVQQFHSSGLTERSVRGEWEREEERSKQRLERQKTEAERRNPRGQQVVKKGTKQKGAEKATVKGKGKERKV